MKIYLIQKGEYGDREVVRALTDKATAEAIQDRTEPGYIPLEMELEENATIPTDPIGWTKSFSIDMKTGEVSSFSIINMSLVRLHENLKIYPEGLVAIAYYYHNDRNSPCLAVRIWVSAPDRSSAEEQINKQLQNYLKTLPDLPETTPA